MPRPSDLQNRILSRLSPDDFALVADHLEFVRYERGATLAEVDRPVDVIVFPETGISSVVARSPEGQSIESGIIGREGFVHPALVLGSDRLPYDCLVQVPGDAYCMARSALVRASEKSASLRDTLLRFATVHATQISFTALSNSVHELDERCARWLLMCHDRSDSDDLPLTHEFLGLMLACRRPSVTNAIHVLEGKGFIANTRGYITIRNRAALEEYASNAYGKPEAEYSRLLGPPERAD